LINLGALTAETLDGDTQTLSFWRCRTCFTLLLNSWIDRWRRLDTLETEESLYRLAPQEAIQMLGFLDTSSAHNSGRESAPQLGAILQIVNTQQPLTSEIKRGR
jgi:hypothetical protein